MTAGQALQPDLLQSLQSLSLGHAKEGLETGSQGANLLKLLQGGGPANPANGFGAAHLAGAPAAVAGPLAAAPPQQPDGGAPFSLPEQAVSSLFGTGGSIWSSQLGGASSPGPGPLGDTGAAAGSSLWGSLPSAEAWMAQPPAQQQQQQQQLQALQQVQQQGLQPSHQQHGQAQHPPLQHQQQQYQQQQQQQQHGLHPPMPMQPQAQQQQQQFGGLQLPPGMAPPPGMLPPQHQQHHQQQRMQPPYQPPLHLGPQQHLGPPQHPGLRSPYGTPLPHQPGQPHLGLLPPQQVGQYPPQGPGQQVPPHLAPQQQQHHQQQHLMPHHHQQQQQAAPGMQGGPRPVMPYNPLSALLQQHSLPPQAPPHVQQQQQQQLPPQPGVQPGAWGPGALFAGLPAMQQLAAQQQQQQQQQQQGSGVSGRAPLPGELSFPPLSPRAGAAGLRHQGPSPPAGAAALLEGMLRGPGSASSPPPAPQGELPAGGNALGGGPGSTGGSRQARPGGLPARKPGTQHVPKPVPGRENRWVDVMDRQHDGRQPRADMRQLDAALRLLADSLMPTPEEHAAQMQAFEMVRLLLQARYPGARVHLFGSVANGLSVRHNNDIDVCLELEDVQAEDQAGKGEVAVAVGELMEAAGMSDVLTLPKARVPVVKFVVPKTKTKVDVTVNNLLACVNTKLLADYCAIDARLAPLVALVKHWAKQRAVNDPYRGTLSSYCYVLMAIHLLQSRPTPVLPALQQLPPTFRRTVGQWTCEFCDDVESLRGFGSANRESLAELVWAFFEYWAWRHNYSHDVVSVRLGGCLHKDAKDWTRRIGNERHLVCIEDPFELTHDLGRTVDRQTRAVLHKEFTRAATLLRDTEDPLDALFQPYRVGQRG